METVSSRQIRSGFRVRMHHHHHHHHIGVQVDGLYVIFRMFRNTLTHTGIYLITHSAIDLKSVT